MKYSVIYADPPWMVKAGRPLSGYKVVDGRQVWTSDNNKSRDLPYNSMSVEDIANMPVKDLCNNDCHLYMWVTNGYLPKSFAIIES